MALLTGTQLAGPEQGELILYDHERYGGVATQGQPGSYHYEAVGRRFHRDVPIVPCDSFDEVFALLDSGKAPFAVVAVDNTEQGLIKNDDGLANRHRIEESPHKLIRPSVLLEVQLCLVGLPGATPEGFQVVRSHPAALNQTREWLERELPQAEIEPHADTAGAVADLETIYEGAVASREAARYYGAHVLQVIQQEPALTEFDILQSAAVSIDRY